MKRRDFLAGAAFAPLPSATLPLALTFLDSEARSVTLGDFFGDGRCVLLVPGYFTCPQLCGLVMHSLLKTLHDANTPRDALRIVAFSIDPADTPAAARKRRESDLDFARFVGGADPAPELHLLVDASGGEQARDGRQPGGASAARAPSGTSASSTRVAVEGSGALLARSLGVRVAAAGEGYEHPAVVAAATPQGRIATYLPALAFNPGELRIAITQAREGVLAAWHERFTLLCSHLEPQAGRHTGLVMNAMRIVSLAGAGALAAWCWRRRDASTAAQRAGHRGPDKPNIAAPARRKDSP